MKQYEDISRINSNLDIVDVARDSPIVKNFRYINVDRYAGYTGSHSESEASFIVTPSSQKWSDKATGYGGLSFNLIALEVTGSPNPRGHDFKIALEEAAKRAGITLSSYSPDDESLFHEREELIALYEKVNEVFVGNLQKNPEMLDFLLKKHGINSEKAKEYSIGYAIGNEELKQFDRELLVKSGLIFQWDNGKTDALFKHRITYPYYKNGRIVYFAARETKYTPESENAHGNKYKKLLTYSEKFPYVSKAVRNDVIYGQDSTIGKKEVFITEGIGDTVAAHIAGMPAISPITTSFPHNLENKLIDLLRDKKRVCIINDNDPLKEGEDIGAGEKGAIKTARLLESFGIPAFIVMLPKASEAEKMDLAEYLIGHSPDELREVLKSDSTLELWEHLLSKVGDYSKAKTLDKIKDFKKFISTELAGMNKDEWEVFVREDVREKFCLNKKDVENTVKDISKSLEVPASNTTSEEGEEVAESKQTSAKIPPLEERLKAYPEDVIKITNDILDNGDPFVYIVDVWNKLHVGDKELGEMLLCSVGCTQLLNAGLGLHNKPSGDQESGKSHGCISMGKLCPEWKFIISTFTAKNLYYNERLCAGAIVYTDDVDLTDRNDEVIQTVKKATADFESPTYLDTVIDGKASSMSIPERVTFWLSSVASITDVQLGTRFICSSTETGNDHNHEVSHKQNGRCVGKPLEEDDKEILICRCILEYICDNLYYVFSPYGFVSTWTEESEKRNHEKFFDVLMSVTVFNYRQRETAHGCLISTLDDWKRAVSIYSHVAQNNSCLLTDEEITILYSIYEMGKAYADGVPHKRLLAYMKECNRYHKSDSTLKRTLIGKVGAENTGFKEKVPGFSFEKVSMPKLDEKGIEIRGAGHTNVICYSYDGDLFDGIPQGADVVEAIRNNVFVTCDYELAEAFEQLFREDPVKAHSLRENTKVFENWKQSLRNHSESSEIIRNPQNSRGLNSEKIPQPIVNKNKKIDNNTLRIHNNGKKEEIENSVCVILPGDEIDIHAKMFEAQTPKNVNSEISEATACDQLMNSETPLLNSEALDSEFRMNSEKSLSDDTGISMLSLLRRALVKFAKERYHEVVPDIDEFVRVFNSEIPEYRKAYGNDAVSFEASKLKMRGWRL